MEYTVFGKLTDFSGKPIAGGDIMILDKSFNPVYQVKTNQAGKYDIKAKAGEYMALIGVTDYGVNYLECWNWNFPVDINTEINMRIGGLEIYSINAFVPQGSTPKIMVYFRPCSLKKYLQNKAGIENASIDMSVVCCNMQNCDLKVTINNDEIRIIRYDEIIEDCQTGTMKGYLLQVEKPATYSSNVKNVIHLEVYDKETGERGEGKLYAALYC